VFQGKKARKKKRRMTGAFGETSGTIESGPELSRRWGERRGSSKAHSKDVHHFIDKEKMRNNVFIKT